MKIGILAFCAELQLRHDPTEQWRYTLFMIQLGALNCLKLEQDSEDGKRFEN